MTSPQASANAVASSGSLIGLNGTDTDATSAATLESFVAGGVTLDAGGNVLVKALSHNDAWAKSQGASKTIATLASVGISLASGGGTVSGTDISGFKVGVVLSGAGAPTLTDNSVTGMNAIVS